MKTQNGSFRRRLGTSALDQSCQFTLGVLKVLPSGTVLTVKINCFTYAILRNYLQLHSSLVIVDDVQADAAIFVIRDSECDYSQELHVLQTTIPSTGQRYLLLYLQMYTAPQE